MAEKEYIDLETAYNMDTLEDWYINSVSDNDTPVWTEEHLEELLNDTIRYFEKRINKLDNYDVEPVRHGHWIEEYDCGYITPHCSECGETALTKEETSYDYVYSSYCPRCGAKLDKTE